jgi:sphingomyelin phosphodiesterase acid-like 3
MVSRSWSKGMSIRGTGTRIRLPDTLAMLNFISISFTVSLEAIGMVRSYRTLASLFLFGTFLMGSLSLCAAQGAAQKVSTVPAVMLSDIHFDPFHDPAKFDKLRLAPVAEWQKILAAPDSATQVADAAKLAATCRVRGVDTPWTLLESSLAAAHAQSPHALFVTLSGDMLAHGFDCRFKAFAPTGTAAEYSDFAAKTVAYVASELHRTFGETPVYMALGNNDSGCADYRENSNSSFLQSTAESFSGDLKSADDRKSLMDTFSAYGDYSVALPAPIEHGRLIVLQDMFLSKSYLGCNGKPDTTAEAAQLEWLRSELAASHARNEQVWVMAHIPPGVDVYSTVTKNRDVCAGQAPEMFLRDEKLVSVLTDFAADIRLAIFAHTHNDEMRLLRATGDDAGMVAAKLVPSISPINGNYPAFTLAEIDAKTAVLKDYRVVSSDSKTGIGAKWSEDYRYSAKYHEPAFGAKEMASILAGFEADKNGAAPSSDTYMQNFMVNGGLKSLAIRLVWPQYVCSLGNDTEAGYRACSCAAAPEVAPAAKPAQ